MKEVVIVAYGRSAIGKSGRGTLATMNPIDLASQTITGVLNKIPEFDPNLIEDLVVGCAVPEASQGQNIGRIIAVNLGLESVPGQTVNRFCSSGLQALSIAANTIKVGEQEIVMAGGVESMSRLNGGNLGSVNYDLMMNNPDAYLPMGTTAENVADQYGVSREDQDAFAAASQQKALAAQLEGRFDEQIIPIRVMKSKVLDDGTIENTEVIFDKDEGVRPGTTAAGLAKLRPAFKLGGSVTAGNSSQTSDGAAFVLMMSAEKADELGLKPIAKFKEFATTGVDPSVMGIGPITAIRKILKVSGTQLEDFDVIELNEAFASQSLAVIRELGLDLDKLNPNGGAIAMGHPLGATGGILTVKMIAELERQNKKKGLISMCIGGGQGAAGIIELV